MISTVAHLLGAAVLMLCALSGAALSGFSIGEGDRVVARWVAWAALLIGAAALVLAATH